MSPAVSVIIPVLNEEKALPACLDSLMAQDGWKEIWIVDGGSEDQTLSIARQDSLRNPHINIIGARRGRGNQMNAGACRATGEVLLFLHGDTLLGPDCMASLCARSKRGLRAGCFTVKFSRPDFSLKLLALLHNWRFTLTRIAYGDQALFIDRELFTRLGGFPEGQLEDLRFGEKLRWSAWQARLKSCVVTDSRKFRELGTWRAVFYVLQILASHKLGRIPSSRFFNNVR